MEDGYDQAVYSHIYRPKLATKLQDFTVRASMVALNDRTFRRKNRVCSTLHAKPNSVFSTPQSRIISGAGVPRRHKSLRDGFFFRCQRPQEGRSGFHSVIQSEWTRSICAIGSSRYVHRRCGGLPFPLWAAPLYLIWKGL